MVTTTMRLDRNLARHRDLPTVLASEIGLMKQPGLAEYRSRIVALYRAIGTVSGARLLVDSSKDPIYGYLMARAPSVNASVLHLVRDPRAVASSRLRVLVRPETKTTIMERALMPRVGVVRSCAEWVVDNALIEVMLVPRGKHMRMRYEDFATHPADEMRRLIQFLDLSTVANPVLEDLEQHHYQATRSHAIGGNPIHARTGKTPIVLDDRWRRGGLRRSQQTVAVALAWPLLRRYSYVGGGGGGRDG